MKHNLVDKFKPLVLKISNDYSNENPIISKEDFENELWIKLLLVLDDLSEISEDEIFSVVKPILRNKCIDINRYYSRRPDTSKYSNMSSFNNSSDEYDNSDIIDLISIEAGDLYGGLFNTRFIDIEDELFGNDLLNVINSWVFDKDEDTKKFISNAINPSDEIINIWEIQNSKYKNNTYNNRRTIPPFSLIKILGISQNKFYKIVKSLFSFLSENGYNPNKILGIKLKYS